MAVTFEPPTDEERKKFAELDEFFNSIKPPPPHPSPPIQSLFGPTKTSTTPEDLQAFYEQFNQDVFAPTYYPPEVGFCEFSIDLHPEDRQLRGWADIEIDRYNQQNGTNYEFRKYHKAVGKRCLGTTMYAVRYEAKDPHRGTKPFTTSAYYTSSHGWVTMPAPE